MARSAHRQQFLADILATAIEGGINHWADVDATDTDVFGRQYTSARILDREDGSEFGTMHIVDLDTIAHGLTELVASDEYPFTELRKANRTSGGEGDYDAADADAIVQFGLYEHIIYG